jgi:uncharacterized membrane protein SpoIIM required for sporulation
VDVDAFVAAHRAEWDRLDSLARRRGKLSGPEADELVTLYQRTSTHLSVLRSSAPDPALLAKLSALVGRARTAIAGSPDPGWGDVLTFLTQRFPAAVYRSRHWWVPTALVFVAVSTVIAWWVAVTPAVQASIAAPEEIRQLIEHDFEDYYSANPAASFAAQVWTNNAWVAAGTLVLGVFLGLPVLYILFTNAANVAVAAGLMAAHGRLDIFLGLITPHGLLELTAVFIAAGTGLRLGWLTGVLLVSGVIEAFVTPSGLPTWARIAIGVAAELAFLAYVWVYGRRAAKAGETGDLASADRGDVLPVSA